jgi:hypothetical protein
MKSFAFGALAGLVIFLAANVLATAAQSDCWLLSVLGMTSCADGIQRTGFPLVFSEEGGFAYRHIFSSRALAVDIAVGVVVSLAGGFAAQRFWPKR